MAVSHNYGTEYSPDWPLLLMLRVQFRSPLKNGEGFLQCFSIAFVSNFAYEAL